MPAKASKKDKEKEETQPAVLKGVYMFPNGDKYDGEYSRSDEGVLERCGLGQHTTADGTLYEGNWENDRMNGQGKLYHPSGAVYEGDFVNNMFH
ncbi:MORN repeat-containing protein 1-like isoform X2 [Ptychodera flava]|uniref:MORN repeat-containing protein 1-like isoform X2 n=1 Tax=Ptychodera flava TaxID=63121 RepID=UPI00396A2EFA